jgi:hypothetical protein
MQMAGATDGLREQGNAEFRNGDFLKAAATYTRAIKTNPGSAVLYRLAAGASLPRAACATLSAHVEAAAACQRRAWFLNGMVSAAVRARRRLPPLHICVRLHNNARTSTAIAPWRS